MSLLSNLLAYSSLNNSGEKEERSSSLNARFLFEDNDEKSTEPKQRVASKSLSKMNLISSSSNSKIDPKSRCLHRITHSLSMKVRKHYYTLFVILETIKKNKDKIKEEKKMKLTGQKLQAGINKINQTIMIWEAKHYQNCLKSEVYKKIKVQSIKNPLAKITGKIYFSKMYASCKQKLFKHFNYLDKLSIKCDLVYSALQQPLKRSRQNQLSHTFLLLRSLEPEHVKINLPHQQQTVFYDQFQLKDNLDQNPRINNEQTGMTNLKQGFQPSTKGLNHSRDFKTDYPIELYNSSRGINQNDTIYNNSIQPISQNIFQEDRHDSFGYPSFSQCETNFIKIDEKIERFQNRFSFNNILQQQNLPSFNFYRSLQTSPTRNQSRSKSKQPFKSCKKILPLRESVNKCSLEQRTYQKVYKSYQVLLNYQQKPFELDVQYESIPKMITKLNPQQLAYPLVEDLIDKSIIFRQFKDSKPSSYLDSLSISNVIGEPFSKADNLINDLQRNREPFHVNNSISEISYVPLIQNDSSALIFTQRDQRQQASFGCDAVNFKNSLVYERESMKKNEQQYINNFVKRKIGNNSDINHLNPQLKLLKSNKKRLKHEQDNQISEPNIIQRNLLLNPNYLKRVQSPVNKNREEVNPLQINLNSFNWDTRKNYETNPTNGQSKGVKSLSFREESFNQQKKIKTNIAEPHSFYDTRTIDTTMINNYSPVVSMQRSVTGWGNSSFENRLDAPVRDTGADPFSKLRSKNSLIQAQICKQKEPEGQGKKYISIMKR